MVGVFVAIGQGCFQFTQSGVNILNNKTLAVCTVSASFALWANRTLRTGRTGRACFTLWALNTLFALYALHTLWACCALCALGSHYSLGSLWASYAYAVGGNGCLLDTEGHNAVCINAGHNYGAEFTLFASFALYALFASVTLVALVTLQPGYHSLSAIIGNSTVGKLKSAPLRQRLTVRGNDKVTAAASSFPFHAVCAGFQHLVLVQSDVLYIFAEHACINHCLYGGLSLQAHGSNAGSTVVGQFFHQGVKLHRHDLPHQLVKKGLVFCCGPSQNIRCSHKAVALNFFACDFQVS